MKIDTLLRLHNDLTIFSLDKPIAVQTDSGRNLIFRQLGKILVIPYFRNYYLSKKPIKLGVITPNEYSNMMKTLELLLESSVIIDDDYGMIIGEYSTSFYKCYFDSSLIGPQLFAKIDFITIKNQFLSRLYLRYSGIESRTLLKSILNERKSKNTKSIEVTS